jgi:FkbM family methyltransferase
MTWFIKARLTPGAVCFDVGTDRGWFSLLMGSIVGEAGKVYSFEPYPPNFSKLNQNLDVNQFSWVSAHNLAICDQTGKMNFRPPSDTVTHHESFLSDCSGVGYLSHQKEAGSIEVETTSIDQFVAQHVIDRLDLIKIDIEGAETAALIGAMNTIRQLRPILLIEYNRETAIRAGSSIEALDDLIESMDYDRYTFYGRLEKLNLKKWDGVSDTQAVFNVYCLPRNILRA